MSDFQDKALWLFNILLIFLFIFVVFVKGVIISIGLTVVEWKLIRVVLRHIEIARNATLAFWDNY